MARYFFGEDSFTARKRVAALAHGAQVRFVDESDFLTESVQSVFDQARGSLFGAALLVVRDPIAYKEATRDVLAEYVAAEKPDQVIFWHRGNPDKRLSLHKTLLKTAEVEQFPGMSDEVQGAAWVMQYVKEYTRDAGAIPQRAAALLVHRVGYDTWALASEIHKLCAISGTITEEAILHIVPQRSLDAGSVFPLLEAIIAKRGSSAISILEETITSGASERFILSMLGYQFRLFLAIQIGLQSGDSVEDIARQSKLHPIAIKKSLGLARRMPLAGTHDILARITASERSLYTTTMDPRSIVTMLVTTLAT